MFRVSRTHVRAAARLCALTLPILALAATARAQNGMCAAPDDPTSCATLDGPVAPVVAGGVIASARALRVAVAQIDGPISARVRALSGGRSDPAAALTPDRHFKVLALGNAGQKLETSDPEIRKLEKNLGVGSASSAIKPRLGVWTDGTWSRLRFADAGADFDGDIWSGIAGVDYVLGDRLAVGMAGGYEKQGYSLSLDNASVQGAGITAAPYAVFKLDDNLSLDATGGYSWLDYDSTHAIPQMNARVTNSTGAYRWFGATNLNATYAFDQWRLDGRIGSIYACETQESLVPGSGAASADQAMAVGSLRLAYDVPVLDGLQPYVSAIGRYAYLQGDPADRTETTFGAGASLRAGRATVGIGGTTLEGREGIKNYTAGVNVRIGF